MELTGLRFSLMIDEIKILLPCESVSERDRNYCLFDDGVGLVLSSNLEENVLEVFSREEIAAIQYSSNVLFC